MRIKLSRGERERIAAIRNRAERETQNAEAKMAREKKGLVWAKTIAAQPRKDPGVAAILGLVIPGAGQIYNGAVGAGILGMICTFVLYLTIVGGLLLHFVLLWRAYKWALKFNEIRMEAVDFLSARE